MNIDEHHEAAPCTINIMRQDASEHVEIFDHMDSKRPCFITRTCSIARPCSFTRHCLLNVFVCYNETSSQWSDPVGARQLRAPCVALFY